MKGTNIAFFVDTIEEKMSQQQMASGRGPQYNKLNTGLEKLLLHYGVKLDQSFLLDKSCYKQALSQERGGGEQKIYFIPMIEQENINNSPLYMQNIKGLATMRISPLEIVPDNINKGTMKISKLFSSSDQAWLMKDEINLNPLLIMPPSSDEEMKSYPLAYILEGNFTSYFKDRETPEKAMKKANINEEDISEEEPALKLEGLSVNKKIFEKGEKAKIFIISSSTIISDQLIDSEAVTTNATFVLNIIDHLNDNTKISVMRSKQQE